MNVTTGKTKDDTPLYRVKDFQPNTLSEWLFDLKDEKCRVELGELAYCKFDTARERQQYATGYAHGLKGADPIREAFVLLAGVVHADMADLPYLEETWKEQLESWPVELKGVIETAILKRRLSSSPSSAPPSGSSAAGQSA